MFQAILDRVVVRPIAQKEQVTASGIILKEQNRALVWGEVISVGELVGRTADGVLTGLNLQPGDKVLYNSRSVDSLDDGNVILNVVSIFGVER